MNSLYSFGSRATLDVAGEVPISRQLRLGVRAENLFDQRVEAAVSSDGIVERATPRTVWIDLRFKSAR